MKQIPLTKGLFAIVDDEDYEYLIKHKWHASVNNKSIYAKRNIYIDGVNKKVYMHRQILSVKERRIYIDHINLNTLDNRKSNLRTCTPAENTRNKISYGENSKYKGVQPSRNVWYARIYLNKKKHFLGYFESEEEAARAYDTAAKELHGEFANLNFP